MDVNFRFAPIVGALAVVPALLFAAGRSQMGVVAALNVLLIAASVSVMLGRAPSETDRRPGTTY